MMKKYSVLKKHDSSVFHKHARWSPHQTLGRLIQSQCIHGRYLCHIFFLLKKTWMIVTWNVAEKECRLCSRNEVFFYQLFISFLLLCWAIITIRKFLIYYSEKRAIRDYCSKWMANISFPGVKAAICLYFVLFVLIWNLTISWC